MRKVLDLANCCFWYFAFIDCQYCMREDEQKFGCQLLEYDLAWTLIAARLNREELVALFEFPPR